MDVVKKAVSNYIGNNYTVKVGAFDEYRRPTSSGIAWTRIYTHVYLYSCTVICTLYKYYIFNEIPEFIIFIFFILQEFCLCCQKLFTSKISVSL